MPQDGLRSAVYRSFVKCDDPKGIAEYNTMRRSKTSSKSIEGVSETKTNTNDLNHSPLGNTGKGKKKIDLKTIPQQESARTSSSHLKEVSKEAQKLNKVKDTNSNGMRFDRNSKEIAKDLLKGVLDLQESLMMLNKLQDASHYMNKFRKKPKVKDDKIEEQAKMARSKSEKYVGYNDQTGFQKSRLSVDASSKDCYDELRTMIRDSLARQNLLPPNFHDKKPDFPQGKILDTMVDIPSTSSTQSSTMNFISFTSSDNSFSSDSTKRSKGSNLIAKLMGLEGIPSPQGFISSPKRFEIETIAGPRRPMFEIDTAKVKKPQLDTYMDDIEEKRLKNIVETMRYKGLLKGKFSEEVSEQSTYSTGNNNKSKNVLIEDSPPIVIMKPMDVSRAEPEENDSHKWVRKSNEMSRGAVDFDEVCRRLRGDNIPMKIQGFREFKEQEISSKLKDKKKGSESTDKVNVPKKKLGENGNLKSKGSSTSHDQVKVKEKKTEIEPFSRRRNVPLQKSNLSMVVSKNKPPLSQKRSDRKKIQKVDTDTEVVVDPVVMQDDNVECRHIEAQIHQSCEDECDNTSTNSTPAAQPLAKEETNAHVNQINDRSENKKLETISESDEEASYLNSHTSTPNKFFEKLTKEKKLFLSSPSFLKCANDLFDIEANSQLVQMQPTISNDYDINDTRLLLDVANELMVQKKLTTQAARPPFLTPPRTLKVSLPLTQLVDEVCKGIEDFSKYVENINDKVITETLFSVLERDMFGIGSWESGWKHGYCFDEVEQVVVDIEKRVFNELIEDLFTGFSQLAF